jgi:hypothetical protein
MTLWLTLLQLLVGLALVVFFAERLVVRRLAVRGGTPLLTDAASARPVRAPPRSIVMRAQGRTRGSAREGAALDQVDV